MPPATARLNSLTNPSSPSLRMPPPPACLQLYSSGIIDDSSCCQDLNHGVLAVGYDDSGPDPYYIIKNSWGGGWGEEGFFRLAAKSKEPTGACGVLSVASYPVKKDSTNPEVASFCGYFGWTQCPARSSCTCNFDLFGLLCLNWGCQAGAEGAAQQA